MSKAAKLVGGAAFIVLGVGAIVLQQPATRDYLRGLGYQADSKMQMIADELDLTAAGERIFKASRPALEGKADFNAHCSNHSQEVSLLGCYTGGQIYVYEITDEQLLLANRVTTAHELLHAIWDRLSTTERERITAELEQLYAERKVWFDEELEAYPDSERAEEMYARAGTKLAELPATLEQHYAKYFQNREQVVAAYEAYQAPFLALQLELEQLAGQIEQMRSEIEAERAEYIQAMTALEAKISRFNQCADTAGCFASQTQFETERRAILTEKDALETERVKLNQKITTNNDRIEKYSTQQAALGELNDAMDSRMELLNAKQL